MTSTAAAIRPHVWVRHRDPLLAAGLLSTLAQHADLCVREVSNDELEALRTRPWPPRGEATVLVTDYETGLAWLQGAARQQGGAGPASVLRVLLVTARCTEAEIRRALEAGVRGYLPDNCALRQLVDAVRTLQRDARYLDELVTSRIAESLMRTPLTARETAVLRLMAAGSPNKRIAATLDIAVGTVKAHTKSILAKLDCDSRTQAVVCAERRGLLVADEDFAPMLPIRTRVTPRPTPRVAGLRQLAGPALVMQ